MNHKSSSIFLIVPTKDFNYREVKIFKIMNILEDLVNEKVRKTSNSI